MTGMKYWSVNCRYLDFNGEDFGTAPIELKIPKFRGSKRISALQAFPLQYHSDATGVEAELLRCGRKFMSFMLPKGTNHCYCNGTAFYKRDGELVQVRVDGRIMVDAAFFRKMNPNYFRSTDGALEDAIDMSACFDWYPFSESDYESEAPSEEASISTTFDLESEVLLEQGDMASLLICSPTVPGFSLKDKLWGKTLSSW